MFRRLPEDSRALVNVEVEGRAVAVPAGSSAAAAALIAELGYTRTSPATGEKRAGYCFMGVCFDCLMVIDGEPSQQACLVTVRKGMRIERQLGSRRLG